MELLNRTFPETTYCVCEKSGGLGEVGVGRLAPVQTVTTNLILELLKLPFTVLLFSPLLRGWQLSLLTTATVPVSNSHSPAI